MSDHPPGDLNAGYPINLPTGIVTKDVDYYVTIRGPLIPWKPRTSGFIQLKTPFMKVRNGHGKHREPLAQANTRWFSRSATNTLADATSPLATVLFSGIRLADSAMNWNLFVTGPDYSAVFGYDYSAQGIPPAPHGSGDTLGILLNVNKTAGASTAVNLYRIGKSFSGNYALRFDMFVNVVVPNSVSTEYVLFGINHSGTKTNWFRNSPGGVPAGWTFDGVFYGMEVDGAGLGDYVNYSSPTTTSPINPTALTAGRRATTLTNEFKVPPNSVLGVPGNNTSLASPTPLWADVEVSQIGKIITWKINNTVIFSYSNATAYASGNIMLGYDDAFDSISLVRPTLF
jgi:hypothetical protein